MLHQAEFGLGRQQRVADMRTELERSRLEARLGSVRREQEAEYSPSEEIGAPKGMFARSVAFAGALFR